MPYSEAPVKRSEWERRVRRAAELTERFSYAAEVLALYQAILEFQRAIYNEISSAPAPAPVMGLSLRAQLDTRKAVRRWDELLSLIEKKGTAKLAQEARELRAGDQWQPEPIVTEYLTSGADAPHSFFARVLLQPHAEWLAGAYPPLPEGSAGAVCPICGARPQAAVLRPAGDGGKRFLLCSLCLTEWEFRRILCPVCDEKDYQKLPRYSASEFDAVRVEACDTCHYYLKSVDLTIDGHAVPLVDEVATVPLDLWATGHGYKKTEQNLMGF